MATGSSHVRNARKLCSAAAHRTRSAACFAVFASSLTIAGCSSTSEGGGLLGLVSPTSVSEQQAAATTGPAPTPPVDPLARPIHVAQTSARAQHCGFVFEPAKLKSAYLAHAAASGVTPDELKKLELTYRFTQSKVRETIKDVKDYCSDEVLQEIREDLPPYVAGDFSKPIRVAKKVDDRPRSIFGNIIKPRGAAGEFDRNEIFKPADQKF